MRPGTYKRTDAQKQRLRELQLGVTPWNKGKKYKLTGKALENILEARRLDKLLGRRKKTNGWKLSPEARANIAKGHIGTNTWAKGRKFSVEEIRNRSLTLPRGPANHNWKGGITPINVAIRGSLEMRLWKKQVFERDDYRCYDCGERGGRIVAHHIYEFANYPRLRCDLNNGQTLCVKCHELTPNYLHKAQLRNKPQ